jgi:hypothetical protein
MAAYKTWSIGDVLTASDLNNSLQDLPLNTAAITASYSAGAIAPGSNTTISIVLPAGRFNIAPIVIPSTNTPLITAYVSSVNAGTAVIGLANNGGVNSPTSFTVYCFSIQMTNGTAAG